MERVYKSVSAVGLLNGDLADTLRANLMNSVQQKGCSSCGESFTCGPERGEDKCWCDHLPRVSLVANEDQDCLCPKCLREAIQELNCTGSSAAESVHPLRQTVVNPQYSLVEGEDYYLEGEMIIFTARYHLRRGYCCGNVCRHCPYADDVTDDRKSRQ